MGPTSTAIIFVAMALSVAPSLAAPVPYDTWRLVTRGVGASRSRPSVPASDTHGTGVDALNPPANFQPDWTVPKFRQTYLTMEQYHAFGAKIQAQSAATASSSDTRHIDSMTPERQGATTASSSDTRRSNRDPHVNSMTPEGQGAATASSSDTNRRHRSHRSGRGPRSDLDDSMVSQQLSASSLGPRAVLDRGDMIGDELQGFAGRSEPEVVGTT
jgi:hypothetical protein